MVTYIVISAKCLSKHTITSSQINGPV